MKRFYVPVLIGKKGFISVKANNPKDAKCIALQKANLLNCEQLENACTTLKDHYEDNYNPYSVTTLEEPMLDKTEYYKQIFSQYLQYAGIKDIKILKEHLEKTELSSEEIKTFIKAINKYLQKRVNSANMFIRRVALYLKHNTEAFAYMDLKLHDVSFYCGSKEMMEQYPLISSSMDNNDLFNDFCTLNYDMFVRCLNEIYHIKFDDMIRHLGDTSLFTLHDRRIIELNRDDVDITNTINNFLQEGITFPVIDITNTNSIVYSPEADISEVLEQLEYVENNLYNDVKNYCKDIIKVYSIIDEFKGNQVDHFKIYLENEEVWLQDEKEKAEAEEREKVEKRSQIIAKYGISEEDLKFLA